MFGPYDSSGSLENILKCLLNIVDKSKVSDCKLGIFLFVKYLAMNIAERRCLAVLIQYCLQYSIQLTEESVLELEVK